VAAAIPEVRNGLPNLCGSETSVAEVMDRPAPARLPDSGIDFENVRSAFAVALHMHQPLIPAGHTVLVETGPVWARMGGGDPSTMLGVALSGSKGDIKSAPIISNLKYMMDHPLEGDNHNAPVFHRCYKRMGEFIPQLVAEGKNPRIMLEYSGTLLWGLREMGLGDVLEALRPLACDPACARSVEWLGMPWGHAVAPSTPVQDYRLHVRAWQHHFAGIFGLEALERVRGFSPSEMALPNHPDAAYEFVRTLKECGYRWVLVQEHTVERAGDGGPIRHAHLPHRLVAKNSRGEVAAITAIIKTQGSDTKLVGQMQPYYEAKGLARGELAGRSVPPLVAQIADGENGGVMMNEFPSKYLDVMSEASGGPTAPANVSEYLEYLDSLGLTEEDFLPIQPIHQKRVWDRFRDGAGPEAMEALIADLKKKDPRFHMDGGSWTSHVSWVRGYESVLGPMEQASARFDEKVARAGVPTSDPRYLKALFHLLTTQTSCYRYWGEGIWTAYGRELCRRTLEILDREF